MHLSLNEVNNTLKNFKKQFVSSVHPKRAELLELFKLELSDFQRCFSKRK